MSKNSEHGENFAGYLGLDSALLVNSGSSEKRKYR